MGSVLRPGIWVWLWNHGNDSWSNVDPPKVAADLVALGVTGVMPHAARTPKWCTPQHLAPFYAAGLRVVPSLGLVTADLIVQSLCVEGADGCMMDWEGAWDGYQKKAAAVVADVVKRAPDAPTRVTDCPWWAPLYRLDSNGVKHPTHPSAPTREFGAIATQDRYVQAYGAPYEGRSQRMLSWAQDPSQYASLGNWDIRPALQLYLRSVRDHLTMLFAHPTVCLWEYYAMDTSARWALMAHRSITALGFTGPSAVAEYQRAQGHLTVDGKLGPLTAAALGLPAAPASVVWFGNG
jgi:hypothetical protein